MVHLHLLTSGFTGRKNRCNNAVPNATWRDKDCDCWNHIISRLWFEVTGDSWVTDFRAIYASGGAVNYLTGYLKKGMYGEARERLQKKGFDRRFTMSRDWPRPPHMRLRGTDLGVWVNTHFEYGASDPELVKFSSTAHYMEQVGSDVTSELMKKRQEKRRYKKAYDSYKTGQVVSAGHNAGD